MIEREVILLANEGETDNAGEMEETGTALPVLHLYTSHPLVPLDPIDPAFRVLINTMKPGVLVQQALLLLLCFILLGAVVTAAGYLIPSF